ncbi:Ribosomal L1 domain-containing protein 1 [Thelotrema lepadinum]|nr:Ribosomal L1 domain-containing protein 1 [Thelotrema lepadinum]
MSKASHHLLKHIRQEQQKESEMSKDLFKASSTSPDDNPEPIWLVITTKKHIVDKKRLKPGKILVPHAIVKPDTSICLITADPQRTYKDVIADPSFPDNLRSRIRVLGVAKIKQRYKSFESKRQLLAEYDTFLADDRIVTLLLTLLGKIVFESSKRPIPVDLQGSIPHKPAREERKPRPKGSAPRVAKPQAMAKEIEKALRSARVHLSPSVTTAIQVGYSNFESRYLQQNIEAVVDGMQQKFIPSGWRNIRSIHIKGPNTAAMPIWLANQLWVEEDDVLEDKEAEEAKALALQKGGKKRKRNDKDGQNGKKPKLLGTEGGFSKEMAERREALRQQKQEAREELEQEDDAEAATATAGLVKVKSADKPSSKVKSKKSKGAMMVKAEA